MSVSNGTFLASMTYTFSILPPEPEVAKLSPFKIINFGFVPTTSGQFYVSISEVKFWCFDPLPGTKFSQFTLLL